MRTRRPALPSLASVLAAALAAVLAGATLTFLGAAPAAAAVADLRINEVESSGGAPVDWVEIVNTGSTTVDAGGLRLKDSDDTRTFAVPAGTSIAPGGYYAIDVDVAGGFGLGAGDAARLFQADGTTLIDAYAWTAHASTTYGRCPDGTGSFVTTTAPTKGAANSCSAPPTPSGGIVFNEVESNGDTVGDFAEVVNTSSAAIDISDWKFTDSEPERVGHVYSVPAGTVVQPGARFVLAEAAFGFGLGAPDGVRLLRADGTTVVDTYSWTAHAATTYGRCPDAAGPIVTTTSSTRGAANDCRPPVRINEVESNGGTPGDWVELLNTGSSAVDVGGFVLKDADDTHSAAIAAGTTIPAGGYLVLDENIAFTFGLGQPDSARLFAADGTTLIDSYSWTTHATTTYGRCPDGTGDLTTTQVPTKGAANTCPGEIVAAAWPGGQDVATIDPQNTFQSNLSGLVYEPSGTSAPGAIWAVRNGPGALYRLTRTDTGYAPSADFAAAGKLLHYPDGLGDVDAEGVTFTSAGPGAGIFVASERDNAVNSVSRPAILRFDPAAGSTDLTAQRDWNLTADLPGLGANLGLEAIAWVPDSYLTARGFVDANTNAAYAPATYPGHGDGLFLVGVEQTGRVYAYALDQTSNGYTRVASFASGFPSVMELTFEPETQQLWVVCDDTCQGRSARFDVDAAGVLAPVHYYERPTGMPNLNNEGFTLAPRAECVSGRKPAFWSDDSSTGGYALRQGTVSCSAPVAQTVAFTATAPTAPVVGQTYVVSATGGPSGNPVTLAESSDACTLTGDTVTIVAPGPCTVTATQAGDADHLAGEATQTTTAVRAATAVAVTVSPDTLTAAVSVVTPGVAPVAGDVTFSVDGAVVGVAPVVAGVATLTSTTPPGATRTVEAAYAGSALLDPSSGTTLRRDPRVTFALTSSVPPTSEGWWSAPVTVTFTCTPQGAPLVACPAPVVLDRSGVDVGVTRTAAATDGGVGTATVAGVMIDLDAPSVRVAGIRDGATYPLAAPQPRCVATDDLSGVASCRLTTTRVGLVTTVTATATDLARRSASTSVRWRVPAVRVVGALRTTPDGAYVVERGSAYRLVALLAGDPAPRMLTPVRRDAGFATPGVALRPGGTSGGLTAWGRTVTVTGAGRDAKVAVQAGERRIVVRLRVV